MIFGLGWLILNQFLNVPKNVLSHKQRDGKNCENDGGFFADTDQGHLRPCFDSNGNKNQTIVSMIHDLSDSL